MIAYVASNSNGNKNNTNNSYTFTLPSDSPYFNNDSSSTQEHNESDYSNKTNSSYEGIDLKAKRAMPKIPNTTPNMQATK